MAAEETPITISEASQYLGVSEAALRQWTTEGRIKAFITPGGHRRYFRSELKKLASTHSPHVSIKDVVVELQETTAQHRAIAHAYLSKTPWYEGLSKARKEALGDFGRKLLNSIIKYVSQPARRQETIEQLREVGTATGELLAQMGLPLTDSVEAFLLHREPIIKVTTQLMKNRDTVSGRVIGTIPLVGQAMDEALITFVAAHQKYRIANGKDGTPSR